jgi:glyoxylase I family protein
VKPGIRGIDNLDIVCDDIEEMVTFYTEVLGLRLFHPYEQGQAWAAFDTGNVVIYVFPSNGEPRPSLRSPVKSENAAALDSLGLAVADLDEAIDALDGRVRWASDAPGSWKHPSGVWYRYRGFYDPAGTLLYVTEPHTQRTAGGDGA